MRMIILFKCQNFHKHKNPTKLWVPTIEHDSLFLWEATYCLFYAQSLGTTCLLMISDCPS